MLCDVIYRVVAVVWRDVMWLLWCGVISYAMTMTLIRMCVCCAHGAHLLVRVPIFPCPCRKHSKAFEMCFKSLMRFGHCHVCVCARCVCVYECFFYAHVDSTGLVIPLVSLCHVCACAVWHVFVRARECACIPATLQPRRGSRLFLRANIIQSVCS